MLRSFCASLLIIVLVVLPIMGERFSANILTFTGASTQTGSVSPHALYHRITWVPGAGLSACTSIALDVSTNGSTWTSAVAATPCNVRGTATSISLPSRYYRITVVGLTGGNLIVGYGGYDSNPSAAGGASAFITNALVGEAIPVRCVDPTGTAFVDCGGGGASATAISVTSGTINAATIGQLPVVNVGTMPTLNVGTMPAVSVTNSQTIGQMPTLNVGTLPTVNVGTMPQLTFTSGSVTNTVNVTQTSGTLLDYDTSTNTQSIFADGLVIPGTAGPVAWTGGVSVTSATMPTLNVGTLPIVNVGTMPQVTVTGTVQNNGGTVTATPTGTTTITGSITNTVTISPTTFTAAQGAAAAAGWPVTQSGTWTANVSATSATVGNTVTISPTGTQSINLAQVLGAALTTANPVINGARGSTTIPSAVADAATVAQRLSKYGDTVVVFAPPDVELTGTIKPTSTAAAQLLAGSGATSNRWKIMSITACNLSGTIATEMDITDSAGTVASFVWTATAVNGEPRCYSYQYPDGWPAAVNSSISGKLTVSDATGVFVGIKANKTGT